MVQLISSRSSTREDFRYHVTRIHFESAADTTEPFLRHCPPFPGSFSRGCPIRGWIISTWVHGYQSQRRGWGARFSPPLDTSTIRRQVQNYQKFEFEPRIFSPTELLNKYGEAEEFTHIWKQKVNFRTFWAEMVAFAFEDWFVGSDALLFDRCTEHLWHKDCSRMTLQIFSRE